MSTTALRTDASADPVRQARIDLAALFRLGARAGWQEGCGGHISMVVPGQPDRILVNTYGRWELITASSLAIVDFEGNRQDGGEGRIDPAAFFIHARMHKAQPDATVVLHSHQPYATALAMLKDPDLGIAYQTSLRFYGHIAYDSEYNGGVLDDAEGDRMASAANKPITFLSNHGIMVTGPTVPQVYEMTFMLEEAAKRTWLARQIGELKPVREEVARHYASRFTKSTAKTDDFWNSFLALLARDEPDDYTR